MTQKRLPHIVLIVLDTHRRDRLNAYGYGRPTSPNITAFAGQATIFDNGISPAQWTIPAHASMFTGEYPTTHQTTQAHLTLDSRFDTAASLLSANGYQTTGFCNNPLVGVLNNGLKRGFQTFYNYGGAFPSVPRSSNHLPKPINTFWEWYTQLFRRLSYPAQNAFAHSDFLFQLSMHPWFVSAWTKLGFKGNTVNSIRDMHDFLTNALQKNPRQPQFVFLNLMETHLPFSPPDTFVNEFAPYLKEDREIRDFLRKYNTQVYRWLYPLEEPLQPNELAILNDMYNAEVAYQDHLLGRLLEFLSREDAADNTLTIIAADHGEGFGEHNFMGHSFVAYQELVHVPLIVKFPAQFAAGQRLAKTVSTRRIFHTMLDLAGIPVFETEYRPASDVKQLSLLRTAQGKDPDNEPVFVEAYAPTTFLNMMEKRAPHLIDAFHCRFNRRAVVQGQQKLVRLDGVQDELFDLALDPVETRNIIAQQPDVAAKLSARLDAFMVKALARRPESWQANTTLNLDEDENLRKHLQALGYIE